MFKRVHTIHLYFFIFFSGSDGSGFPLSRNMLKALKKRKHYEFKGSQLITKDVFPKDLILNYPFIWHHRDWPLNLGTTHHVKILGESSC